MGKKLYITGGIAAGLILVYVAGGFWAIPASTNWALKKYVDPLIDREVTTEKVEFNPFTLHLNVKGLNVQKSGTPDALLRIEEIDTKLKWSSLFKFAPLVQHFKVNQLQANIVRTGLATFNFSDIIDKFVNQPEEPKEEDKDKKTQKFSIDNFEIINSGVKLDDKFRGKVDEITDLQFALPLISNFETQAENPITPKLSLKFDGEPLSIDAKSLPFSISKKTGVDFELKSLNLSNAASFNPVPLNAHIVGGTADAKLNLAFANEDAKIHEVKHLRLKGQITINNLVVQDDVNKPYDVLKVKRIDANLKEFALFAQRLDFGEIKVTDPDVVVTRNTDGLNLAILAQNIIKEDGSVKSESQDRTPSTSKETAKESNETASAQTDQSESKASAEEAVTAQAKQEPAAPAATTANNEPSLAAKTAEASKLTSDTQVQEKEKVEAASEETQQKPEPAAKSETKTAQDKSDTQSADTTKAEAKPGDKTVAEAPMKAADVPTAKQTAETATPPVPANANEKAEPATKAEVTPASDLTTQPASDNNAKPESKPKTEPTSEAERKETSVNVGKESDETQSASENKLEAQEKAEPIVKAVEKANSEEQQKAISDTEPKPTSNGVAKTESKQDTKAAEPVKTGTSIPAAKEPAATESVTATQPTMQKAEAIAKADNSAVQNKAIKSAPKPAVKTSPKKEPKPAPKVASKQTAPSQPVSAAESVAPAPQSNVIRETIEYIPQSALPGTSTPVQTQPQVQPAPDTPAATPAQETVVPGEIRETVTPLSQLESAPSYARIESVQASAGSVTSTSAAVNLVNYLLSPASAQTTDKAEPAAAEEPLKVAETSNPAAVAPTGLEPDKSKVETSPTAPAASEANKPDTSSQPATQTAEAEPKVSGETQAASPAPQTAQPAGQPSEGQADTSTQKTEESISAPQRTQQGAESIAKTNVEQSVPAAQPADSGTPSASNQPALNSAEATEQPASEPQENAQTAETAAPGWYWNFDKIAVVNGTVNFTDNTVKFQQNLSNINATISSLNGEKGSKANFEANLNVLNGNIEAKGDVGLTPLLINIEEKTKDLSIPKVMPYISPFVTAKINDGKLSNQGKITLDLSQATPNIAFTGSARASSVAVTDANNAQVAKWNSLNVNNIDVKSGKNISIALGDIALEGPSVNVIRFSDGTFNFDKLTKSSSSTAQTATPKTAAKAEPTPAVYWNIGKTTVSNGQIQFNDQTVNFSKTISNLAATVSGLSSQPGTSSAFTASFGALGGSLNASGSFNLSPFKLNLKESVKGLHLAELTPYIKQFTNAHVVNGQLTSQGDVAVKLGGSAPEITFNGNSEATSINLTDAQGTPFAKWQDLKVTGINFSSDSKLSLVVKNIALSSPSFYIAKSAKGKFNIETLVKSESKAPVKTASSAKATIKTSNSKASGTSSGLPSITLDKISINNGSVFYKDSAMEPEFTLHLSALKGSLTDFTTAKGTPANLDVTGNLNGTPMSAKGSIAPFAKSLSLNLDGSVTSLNMPILSPYSVEFTGYPIKQGQVTYKGAYKIDNGELTSTNNIVINKLEFGAVSPKAKETLPVGLAVSLLQDRSGQIDLNLPVTGSLNDPEFSVGGIIVKVIVNLITKAVTAPFALIGSMFGGENLDLNNLAFVTGSARLNDQTEKALAVVGKAMTERPGIKIQITGIGNTALDEKGLKEKRLMRQMIFSIYRDSTSSTDAKKLTPVQMNQAIRNLFKESDAPNKPKTDKPQEMMDFLMQNIRVPTQDLQELATRRAEAVRNYLINKEKIKPDRLFVVAGDVIDNAGNTAGVKLELQQ
ncbi:DUF748 domain-containing protein [Turicimonas muris]|uniref:DUF748 domain-containing protein n=1 Tax=Turicimonas muris TaxID=1796652 RepID=UPI0025B6D904|nr:DUF748 domain-containing protein [Turicimonas muris]